MAFKFIIVLAFAAVASAGLLPAPQVYHAAPQSIAVAQPVYAKAVESYDPHPKYQFSYAVNDEHTGDVKSQVESRDGDVVQGEYSLIDSDGYKRIVQYTADPVHGFNAIVNREPLGYAVKAAPVAYAAPTLIKSAPVAYAPALVKSAPVAYAAAPALNYAPAAYATQSIIKAAPVSYAAPALIKSAPVAYAAAPALSYAPAAYASQSIVKAAPVAYAAAPAYSYNH